MITATDIERARRVYVAAIGTICEDAARSALETLVAKAKQEHAQREARLS
jgi:hypothetical protein